MRFRWAVAVMLLVGCVHEMELLPATPAQAVVGYEGVARTEVEGVKVMVEGAAWRGRPSDLEAYLTPVRVSIQNESNRPITIRYSLFALETSLGFRYNPLPPLKVLQEASSSYPAQVGLSVGIAYPYPYSHFYVSPYYAHYYPFFAPWPGSFFYDPFYYDRYYGYWVEPLPSRDMIEHALPEGVLEAGGRVSGFLYFQQPSPEVNAVTFQAKLVDANTEEQFGVVEIPFVVAR
ncbi:MAG: hypothetical protein ACOZIN_02590 [Myxococcota bacterium]